MLRITEDSRDVATLLLLQDDDYGSDADIIHPCIPCWYKPKRGYIVLLLDLLHDLSSHIAFDSMDCPLQCIGTFLTSDSSPSSLLRLFFSVTQCGHGG